MKNTKFQKDQEEKVIFNEEGLEMIIEEVDQEISTITEETQEEEMDSKEETIE